MVRGQDTIPMGISSAEEWKTTTAERQSAFMALVVANTAQMMTYKADVDDENTRASGQSWNESRFHGAEIFSAAASEGSGDCEDLAILILLMKLSLEALDLENEPGFGNSPLDRVLLGVQAMCRTYIPFVVLSSVNAANVAAGMAKSVQPAEMGAHMTLMWMPGDTVKRNIMEVGYPVERFPAVKPAAEGQLHVILSEGTGPFSTGIDHTDAPVNREAFGGVMPIFTAPLAEPWRDPFLGTPKKTTFFSAAIDMYGVYIDEQGPAVLSYCAMFQAKGSSQYTYGAFFECMMNNMDGCKLLPMRAIPPDQLVKMTAATRASIPPPLMDLSPVTTSPPSDQALRAIKAAVPMIPTGNAPTLATFSASSDSEYEVQGYWVTAQALSQPELVRKLVQQASTIAPNTVADMQWEWWPMSDYLGGTWRVTVLVKRF